MPTNQLSIQNGLYINFKNKYPELTPAELNKMVNNIIEESKTDSELRQKIGEAFQVTSMHLSKASQHFLAAAFGCAIPAGISAYNGHLVLPIFFSLMTLGNTIAAFNHHKLSQQFFDLGKTHTITPITPEKTA